MHGQFAWIRRLCSSYGFVATDEMTGTVFAANLLKAIASVFLASYHNDVGKASSKKERLSDANVVVSSIVQKLAEETMSEDRTSDGKNPAAVSLAGLGGKKWRSESKKAEQRRAQRNRKKGSKGKAAKIVDAVEFIA
jgi:hypothetical protein